MSLYYLSTINQYLGCCGVYDPQEVIEADRLEKVWKESQVSITPYQLVDLFLTKEAYDEDPEGIKHLEDLYTKKANHIIKLKKHFQNKMASKPANLKACWRAWYDGLLSTLNENWTISMLEAITMKINSLKSSKKTNNRTSKISLEDIRRVKEHPLSNFIKFNSSHFAKCIWHDEKHPSTHYYRAANRVFCFSCREFGDPIDVIKKLYGLNFAEAVKYLLNK